MQHNTTKIALALTFLAIMVTATVLLEGNQASVALSPRSNLNGESYVFESQPNGAILAFNVSSGATYESRDLGFLLNLMPNNASVTLKNGKYTLSSPYTPKYGQSVIGESRSGVQIVGYPTRTDYALIFGQVCNVELANFTFNVNNPNPSAAQVPNCGLGIVLIGSRNVVCDVTVQNAYLQGIVMGLYGSNVPSEENLVENCEVYGCGNDGIVLDCTNNSQISNCYIHDSFGPLAGGVNVAYGSRNCTVKDCTANNTAYGFATDNSLGAPVESIIFMHNTSNASYVNGFMVDGGFNVTFDGNTATSYAKYGFVSYDNLNGASPACVSYRNNLAADSGSTRAVGYFLARGRDFSFSANRAAGNSVGLKVESMNGPTYISSSTFSGNMAHDIVVVSNPAYTSIADCTMGSSSPLWVDSASASNTTINSAAPA